MCTVFTQRLVLTTSTLVTQYVLMNTGCVYTQSKIYSYIATTDDKSPIYVAIYACIHVIINVYVRKFAYVGM